MFRIGVDVGGTFTDFTVLDESNSEIRFFKVPSTPREPSEAIEDGLRQMIAEFGLAAGEIGYLGHGTTVATNIVIERRGARTGLLTTRGFRDVLELGRQARPSIYDYRVQKPPVLVPRDRRAEVTERVGPDGSVLVALDEDSLAAAIESLRRARVESVAICFLHSYRTPAHERAAKRAVERLMPGAYVSVSSEILPEFREFERVSTTVINAFVGPRMGRYLEQFQKRVRDIGIPAQPYTIHSNGGLMSIDTVRACPVRSCVSGPAAGVVGAAEIGKVAGFPNLITFDVGGTSTDVSLVYGASPTYTANRLVAGYPVKTPMIDIHVIGAGGGSIARIDDAGALKVGPESAGAEPGPVAYGRGGTAPTITDANLCLGRLDATSLLGGRMTIDLEAARRVIHDKVAKPLGLSLEAAAHGVVQIANANMSRAIRSVSVEKGYDVSEFALCAFGGAGPLHAAEVAVECGVPKALIPREPGTLCARGMLLTDLSSDYVRSHFTDASEASWAEVLALFEAMTAEGHAWLDREAVPRPRRRFKRVLDARYRGQNFEVKVDCDGLDAGALPVLIERFHAAHKLAYGYAIPARDVEFVSARVQAIGEVPKAPQPKVTGGATLTDAIIATRPLYVDARLGWREAMVYQRERLPIGVAIAGPAVINEMSATTIILADQSAEVDPWGNIVLRVAWEFFMNGRIADPIQMEVFSNRLLAIAEDMGSILIRSSFSTNIKERRDCSTAIIDARGRLVAQAEHIPIHLGAMMGAVETIIARYDLADLAPGDAFICNDPYLAGGSHLPDISIITPIHVDGQVRFFCGNIAHHADVGGRNPGSTSGTSRSIYEEGIRLPVIRIARGGAIEEDLVELIVANTRDPEERRLDLRTQVGTNVRGGAMLVQLCARMGWPVVAQAIEDILTYTSRRLKNRIAALPDGDYTFGRAMDDDGFPGTTVPIVCTARIRGEELEFDFAGSGPEARGAINLPDSALKASVYYCVKAVLDPGLMPNQGAIDPIKITAPAGTIVNPRPPAAVAARAVTSNRLCGAVFGALFQALPRERVMASCNDSTSATSVSGWHPRRRATYVYPESMGGGVGAFGDRDGMDAVHVHTVNSTNLPVEALELEYPLLLDEYCFVPDSGGAGRHRGGLGMARQIRVLNDGTTLSVRSDAHVVPAPGVFGGLESNVTRITRNPGTNHPEVLHSKASGLAMKAGETVRVETLGGGGYGPPAERPLPLLAADLREGKVSIAAAERDYGPAMVKAALAHPES